MRVNLRDGGIPLAVKLLEPSSCPTQRNAKLGLYKALILLMTFVAYTCYHMSRKPISVVKNVLIDCGGENTSDVCSIHEPATAENNATCTSFIEQIDGKTEAEAKRIESSLDTSYLFSYAFFMFVSGIVAERVDLRYFLCVGMMSSGLFTCLFGLAYVWDIRHIGYFIAVQIVGGAVQSSGWPAVVTIVANWFGRGKKGAIFGIWNSHTSIGNILGSLLAGVWVNDNWALSFVVPGLIIMSVGFIFWFTLVPKPELVGLNEDESQVSEGLT